MDDTKIALDDLRKAIERSIALQEENNTLLRGLIETLRESAQETENLKVAMREQQKAAERLTEALEADRLG
jgi:hypothetical protein